MTDRLERVYNWRRPGVTMDRMTVMAWEAAEHIIGHTMPVLQGCYTSRVGVSAGTHDLGGVCDGEANMSASEVRGFMRVGWCVFPRAYLPGYWPPHTHMVLNGHPHVAQLASLQRVSYANGWDGLGSINPFTGRSQAPWHGPCNRIIPVPKFRYIKEEDMPLNAEDMRKIHAAIDERMGDVVDVPSNSPYASSHPHNRKVSVATAAALTMDYVSRLSDRLLALESKIDRLSK